MLPMAYLGPLPRWGFLIERRAERREQVDWPGRAEMPQLAIRMKRSPRAGKQAS